MFFFFLNDTATPEIYPLPLHDALPIPQSNRREGVPALARPQQVRARRQRVGQPATQHSSGPLAARESPTPGAQVQVMLRRDDLEPEEYQPLAQPPLRQHAPHARGEPRAAPAGAHAPQA